MGGPLIKGRMNIRPIVEDTNRERGHRELFYVPRSQVSDPGSPFFGVNGAVLEADIGQFRQKNFITKFDGQRIRSSDGGNQEP